MTNDQDWTFDALRSRHWRTTSQLEVNRARHLTLVNNPYRDYTVYDITYPTFSNAPSRPGTPLSSCTYPTKLTGFLVTLLSSSPEPRSSGWYTNSPCRLGPSYDQVGRLFIALHIPCVISTMRGACMPAQDPGSARRPNCGEIHNT